MNPKKKQIPLRFTTLETIVDGIQETKVMALFYGNPSATISMRHTRYIDDKPLTYTVAYINQLFVHEKIRNRGAGSQLIEECCKIAKAEGCTTVCLIVNYKNSRVLPFYAKNGFLPAYEYQAADRDLILCRQLAPWTPVNPPPVETPV